MHPQSLLDPLLAVLVLGLPAARASVARVAEGHQGTGASATGAQRGLERERVAPLRLRSARAPGKPPLASIARKLREAPASRHHHGSRAQRPLPSARARFSRLHAAPRSHLGCLVGEQRVLGGLLAVGPRLELGEVAVVVALHLEVEHLGLAGGGRGDEVLVQQRQDGRANLAQLLLHLRRSAWSVGARAHATQRGVACCGASSRARLRTPSSSRRFAKARRNNPRSAGPPLRGASSGRPGDALSPLCGRRGCAARGPRSLCSPPFARWRTRSSTKRAGLRSRSCRPPTAGCAPPQTAPGRSPAWPPARQCVRPNTGAAT